MRLQVSFSPDLVAMMLAEVAAGQKAVSTTMNQAGLGLKAAWRAQITGAGLGQRLANTIRAQTYPKGRNSLDAAALVWSNAPVIIGAHDTGPLIRSASGFWLAIPLPAAGKARGGKRITPGMWGEARSAQRMRWSGGPSQGTNARSASGGPGTGLRLRFVYRSRGPSLLVADAVRLNTRGQAAVSRSKTGRGQMTVPIFLLVRQVKLPKRLDLARDAERAQAGRGQHSAQLGRGSPLTPRWTSHRHWHILPMKLKENAMATRNVVLTDTQSDLVDRLVSSGRYQNASEALRAGLRLLEREESELGALRDRLTTGIEQARSGQLAEGSGEDAVRRAFATARTTR